MKITITKDIQTGPPFSEWSDEQIINDCRDDMDDFMDGATWTVDHAESEE